MSFLSAIPLVGGIIEKALGIVDKAVPDKDLAAKLKSEIQMEMMKLDYDALQKEISAQAQVVTAEAQGQSWLQRNWRPLLMLVIIAIIANNYVVFPYLSMFTTKVKMLEMPKELFQLMFIGVGGYVVGRSGEKIVKDWRTGKDANQD